MKIKHLSTAALIAAIYAALTYAAAALGLSYGQIQFRFSEALCVLAAFTPAAVPGLTLGCLLGNLGSTLGPVDWICGTLATLLASLSGYALRNVKGAMWLVPLPCVVFNALIVGAELAVLFGEGAFLPVFAVNAAWVGVGQAVVCYLLGIPLYLAIERTPALKRFFSK